MTDRPKRAVGLLEGPHTRGGHDGVCFLCGGAIKVGDQFYRFIGGQGWPVHPEGDCDDDAS